MNATKSLSHVKTVTPTTIAQDASGKNHRLLPQPESKRAALKEQLAAEIRSRMAVPPDQPQTTNANGLKDYVASCIKSHVDSLKSLEAMQVDVQEMIPPLCAANLVYRQVGDVAKKTRVAVLAEYHRQMVEETIINIPRPKNVIHADVLALDTEDLVDWLRESIDSNITSFVDSFFQAMDDLVDQSAAGLAIWTSPTTLQYSFVRQIVEQTVTDERTDTRRIQSEDSPRAIIERRETVLSGTTSHLFARYEHHVFNACETTLETSAAIIPLAVQSYIDTVPDWLRPIHHIIDGTIANVEVIEKQRRIEQWNETTAVEKFVYARDPALVIGDVVLIGWDADDIQREEARRQNIALTEKLAEAKRQAGWLAPLWGLLTAAIAFLSLYLFWQPTSAAQLWAACATLFFVTAPCVLFIEYSNKASAAEAEHIGTALGLFSLLLGVGLLLAFRLTLWSAIGTSAYLLVTGIVITVVSQIVGPHSSTSRNQTSQWLPVREQIVSAFGCCLVLSAILYLIVGRSLFDAIEQKAPPTLNVETETQSGVSQEMQSDS